EIRRLAVACTYSPPLFGFAAAASRLLQLGSSRRSIEYTRVQKRDFHENGKWLCFLLRDMIILLSWHRLKYGALVAFGSGLLTTHN
ncbi:hypothetical protein COCVIDRAFT_103071, partial [Bipolaris victoriae FI3]